jgi:hypothetical protein
MAKKKDSLPEGETLKPQTEKKPKKVTPPEPTEWLKQRKAASSKPQAKEEKLAAPGSGKRPLSVGGAIPRYSKQAEITTRLHTHLRPRRSTALGSPKPKA